MKKLKKILFCMIGNVILSAILARNVVYADLIGDTITITKYSPLYYIAIIGSVIVVMIVSICILRKIYKENQEEKDEEEKIKGGIEDDTNTIK